MRVSIQEPTPRPNELAAFVFQLERLSEELIEQRRAASRKRPWTLPPSELDEIKKRFQVLGRQLARICDAAVSDHWTIETRLNRRRSSRGRLEQ
jgi:hypothetical protein